MFAYAAERYVNNNDKGRGVELSEMKKNEIMLKKVLVSKRIFSAFGYRLIDVIAYIIKL